jgi:hypothetical protein
MDLAVLNFSEKITSFAFYLMDLAVLNFSEKITCFAFYLVLSTNLKRRWLDLFCNYHHIQRVCNHSTALVVIV